MRGKRSEYIEIPRLGAVIETTRARTVSAKSGRICSGIQGYTILEERIGGRNGKWTGIGIGNGNSAL